VNQAFQTLSKLIGRDRIIVIGTFKTHLKFLRDAAQSGFPPFLDKFDTETSRVKWAEKAIDFEDEFRDILDHCDYDGEHVNPSTIIDVISGRQVHFPTPVAGRVIPYSEGVRSVFFYIHTHGWSYAIPQLRPTTCDLCVAMGNSCLMLPDQHPKNVGHDHSSLRTREWYLGMPHPGDPLDFGSVVFPSEGRPCLDPSDKRLKSFVTQVVAGAFKLSDLDGSFPPLYTFHEWKDKENGVVTKEHRTSWDPPTDDNYPKAKVYQHNKASLPVFMNMLTRETARGRPDAAEHAMTRLPEGWVEFVHYQNCFGTSTWVLNPATSNCPLNVFLHDSHTADSDAPFILDFSLWQHFFMGFKKAIQQSPFTKFVVCFDACGSGGLAKVRCFCVGSSLQSRCLLQLAEVQFESLPSFLLITLSSLPPVPRSSCLLCRSSSTIRRTRSTRKLLPGLLPLSRRQMSRFTPSRSGPGCSRTWKRRSASPCLQLPTRLQRRFRLLVPNPERPSAVSSRR
jgi:hypothetical protein